MSDARRARAERRAALASRVAQTAPFGGRPHRSPSPAVNAATGPAGDEQQASSQHPSVRQDGCTATPTLTPAGSSSRVLRAPTEPRNLSPTHRAAPTPPVIATLLGGLQAPPTSHHVKPFIRRVSAASTRQGALPDRAAPKAGLTFSSEDHPSNSACSGALPMLCTPTICQVAVTRTLIDGGAGLSVLSVEAFDLLRISLERLQPSRPFSGVGGGSSSSLGQIRLPVTFGTYRNFRTELVDFDIAPSASPTTPSSATQRWPSSWPQRTRRTTS